MKYVVVFASTSGIAQAVAEELLTRKRRVILCARNADALRRQSKDFGIRYGHEVPYIEWDLADLETHAEKCRRLFAEHDVEGVMLAPGLLPEQQRMQEEPLGIPEAVNTNFTHVAVLLECIAAQMEPRGTGFISCISSVAGDRGRRSNYVYGASKAALSAYLQGMRNRLHKKGILVQTIKPGTVHTRMTAHLKAGPLMASPRKVAAQIADGLARRKNVVYVPGFWYPIMMIIRMLPEALFKRLPL